MTKPLAIVLVLFAIDLGLGALHLGNFAFDRPSWKLDAFVDLDGESNLPTWYSSSQLLAVALLFGLFAARNVERARPTSWPLLLFPAVFVVLSLDEVAEIHEWIGMVSDRLLPGGDRKATVFSRSGIWMFLVGVPFLVAMLALVAAIRPYLRSPGVTRKLLAGISLLVAAATGGDVFSNFHARDSWPAVFGVAAEEVGEMLGVTMLIWAGLDLLLAHRFRLRLDPARPTVETPESPGGGAARATGPAPVSPRDAFRPSSRPTSATGREK